MGQFSLALQKLEYHLSPWPVLEMEDSTMPWGDYPGSKWQIAMCCNKAVSLGPSRRGAFLVFNVSLSCSCSCSDWWNCFLKNIAYVCQMVCWLHRRGHNFCLQKSRMPLGRIGIFAISICVEHKHLCWTFNTNAHSNETALWQHIEICHLDPW